MKKVFVMVALISSVTGSVSAADFHSKTSKATFACRGTINDCSYDYFTAKSSTAYSTLVKIKNAPFIPTPYDYTTYGWGYVQRVIGFWWYDANGNKHGWEVIIFTTSTGEHWRVKTYSYIGQDSEYQNEEYFQRFSELETEYIKIMDEVKSLTK